MQAYHIVFGARGTSYDNAMRMCPDARADEFRQVVSRLSPPAGSIIGDIPAGGDYLRRFIPPGVGVLGFDPATGFGARPGGDLCSLPWSDGQVDHVASIAASHHVERKTAFFAELRRVCRPGGRLVLADVETGSATASFLDDFVGSYNTTGHSGLFLHERETADALRSAGWTTLAVDRVLVRWRFRDFSELTAFCRSLFDLRGIDEDEVLREVNERMGVDEELSGIALRWPMMMFTARRD